MQKSYDFICLEFTRYNVQVLFSKQVLIIYKNL